MSAKEIQFIKIKNKDWIENQKFAGKVLSEAHTIIKTMIDDKVPKLSLRDLEQAAIEHIEKNNCTPTFLNYKGFPGAICASVNKQIVHGIPTDYVLKEGDVVKIDFGATFKGAITDAARTHIFGEPHSVKHVEMIDLCRKSLYNAINELEVGKRVGVIGNTIYNTVKDSEFTLITKYGGHGISDEVHAQPFVANKASKDEGVRLVDGMVLAIEPMLIMGRSSQTKTASDKWTVYSEDIGCHFEDSVLIQDEGITILTKTEF